MEKNSTNVEFDFSEGLTQKEIGEKIGWTQKQVADYNRMLNQIIPKTLDFCKQHQKGRGNKNIPNGITFDFSEGWFRTSGLYDQN